MKLFAYSNPLSVVFIGPEILLVLTLLAAFLVEVGRARGGEGSRARLAALAGPLLSLFGVVLALASVVRQYGLLGSPVPDSILLFNGTLALDPFALFFKVLVLVATGVVLLFAVLSKEIEGSGRAEFSGLVLATALGAMLLAGSVDLLMIYLAIELVSIPSYLLAGFVKGSRRSSEAALKYVIYGAVASGTMIYGFSLLYGLTGETGLVEIRKGMEPVLAGPAGRVTGLLAILLSLAGFGYKVAAVPFHMWCPDVYEGAPLPATAFFSIVPKAAGFAGLIRFFYVPFVGTPQPAAVADLGLQWSSLGGIQWPMLLAVVSVLTMTLGNLSAIPQTNLKRLLAYSSIAHAGYLLMGLVLLTQEGLRAIVFYLAVYLFMTLGAFLVVLLVANEVGGEELRDWKGLAWRGGRATYLAVTMGLFLFALTGLPPTAGFIGKFYLFKAVVDRGLYWLALIAVLNSVVSLYYYMRVVQAMFLEFPAAEGAGARSLEIPVGGLALASGLAIPTLLFGVYWDPLAVYASLSLQLFGTQ